MRFIAPRDKSASPNKQKKSAKQAQQNSAPANGNPAETHREESFRVLDFKLALFFLLICAILLVIVFPNRDRLNTIFRDAQPTLNTVQYLTQWVAENPQDTQARLALARKHLENFEPKTAHTVLQPIVQARPQTADARRHYWSGLMLLHRAIAQTKAAGAQPQFPHYGLTQENAADATMPTALRLALAEQSIALKNTSLAQQLLKPAFFESSTLSAMQVIHAMNLLYDITQNAQATALGLNAFSANPNATLWHKILKTLISADQIDQATAFYLTTPEPIQQSSLYRKNLITYKMRLAPDTITAQDSKLWLSTSPELPAVKAALALTLAHTKLPASEVLARKWYQQEPSNPKIQKQLHDLLRWQGKIAEALLISEQRMASHPSEKHYAIALEEAWALSDYQALGRLYQQAIFNNWLAPHDVPKAIKVLDRALPAAKVTDTLAALFDTFPGSHLVREHYLQRLADRSDHDAIIDVWTVLPSKDLRISLPLRKRLARVAYQQHKLPQALNYLVRGIEWHTVSDPQYLDTATQLAQQVGTPQINARLAYHQFILTNNSFDYYLAIRQAHNQNNKRIGDALLAEYKKYNHPTLLALATQHARTTQNSEMVLSLLETLKADPNNEPIPSLWVYAAGIYQAQGNTAAAKAALDKAFLAKPTDPELQYQQFSQTLALNHEPQVIQLFDLYNDQPETVPEALWELMAEAADRLDKLPEAIHWYTRVAQTGSEDSWPIYRLAVLLARIGEVDRSYYLKKHLLNTLGTPSAEELSDIDLLVMDEFLGQQVSTGYIQAQLASRMQPQPTYPEGAHGEERYAQENKSHNQPINLTTANQYSVPLMLASNAPMMHATTSAMLTPAVAAGKAGAEEQHPKQKAKTAPSPEAQQLYQQLIARLLESYQYYAVNQWHNMTPNTSLTLAPWQQLALAQAQNETQTGNNLVTTQQTQATLSDGAYYEALLLAGKNHQAWRYGKSKLQDDSQKSADDSQRRTAYRSNSDITDYNYLRELHLSQFVKKAHKWSVHYRFLADRSADTEEHVIALNYQVPSNWGAWQLDAVIGQAPKSNDLIFNRADPQTRFISAGHHWLDKNIMGTKIDLLAQATLSRHNRENFLGFKIAASGAGNFGIGKSSWQIQAGLRQPFEYNNQIDFLTHSDYLGFSLATAHHSLLSSFVSFRQDNIRTTAGDTLGKGYRFYAEISSDLFKSDRLFEPYIAWYQQEFYLSDIPRTPLPELSTDLGQTVRFRSLFLADYQQAMAGVRWGIQNDALFSRPIEHILDIGLGYEPESDRTGYAISDQWLLRTGAMQFVRFKLGLSELSPNGSRQAWVELGFEQLME